MKRAYGVVAAVSFAAAGMFLLTGCDLDELLPGIGGDGGTTCTTIGLCVDGYVWDDVQCACVPVPAGQCNTDADCRLFSDYCTGCDCRALSKAQTDPVCPGNGVQCFADPCMNKTAACVDHACVVR